jgi:hypothetical protein
MLVPYTESLEKPSERSGAGGAVFVVFFHMVSLPSRWLFFLFLAGFGAFWDLPREKARMGASRRLDIANAVLQHKSVVFACFKME